MGLFPLPNGHFMACKWGGYYLLTSPGRILQAHTHTQSFTVFLEEEEVEKLHRAEVLKGFVYVFKGAKFKDLWWSGE